MRWPASWLILSPHGKCFFLCIAKSQLTPANHCQKVIDTIQHLRRLKRQDQRRSKRRVRIRRREMRLRQKRFETLQGRDAVLERRLGEALWHHEAEV